MPRLTEPFGFEEVANLIINELRKSERLSYIPDDSIVLTNANNKDVIPEFKNCLIRVAAPDSGFLQKTPRIGAYYRNTYIVAIDMWVKSSSVLADRLLSGEITSQKGIYELFQDVSDILEHNTFDNQLDSYPGSSIMSPVPLASDNTLIEGIGFLWFGNQDNLK